MGGAERLRRAIARMTTPAPLPGGPRAVVRGAERIAIVGYAASLRFTPFEDRTLTIWGMNDQHNSLPRVDVLFELHAPDVVKAEGHWESLKTLTVPIVMQDHYDEIPTSVRYPLEDLALLYTLGGRHKPPLTSSAALMLSLAVSVEPRPRELLLYGLDMERGSEFDGQREAAAFWIGVAHARGIHVTLQPSSDILKPWFVYAYEEPERELRVASLKERRMYIRANLARARDTERFIVGKQPELAGLELEQSHARLRETQFAAERFEGALQQVEYDLLRCV